MPKFVQIKKGYKLHVVDPDGVLLGTISLEEYYIDSDLSRLALTDDISGCLPEQAYEETNGLQSMRKISNG